MGSANGSQQNAKPMNGSKIRKNPIEKLKKIKKESRPGGYEGMIPEKEDKIMEGSYRGIEYEVWKDGGFIVELGGDEVFCDNMKAVERVIDEYLDGDGWW